MVRTDSTDILYLTAALNGYFPSAIFKLDAKTGKRLPGTVWHSGRIYAANIGDIDYRDIEKFLNLLKGYLKNNVC